MDTVTKNVQVKVTAIAGPEVGAAFKTVEKGAIGASTTVQAAARADTQALRGTAAAAGQTGAALEQAGKRGSLGLGGVAKDLKFLDKGLMSATQNAGLMAAQMGLFQADGKIAKGLMALMIVHEISGLFRGLALTAKAAGGSLVTYISGAAAATAANKALAESHLQVAAAAQVQAQAENGAAVASVGAAGVGGGRRFFTTGAMVGGGLGGLGGFALAQQQGMGFLGTAGLTAGGAGLGALVGRFGPGFIGGVGGFLKAGMGAAGIVGAGLGLGILGLAAGGTEILHSATGGRIPGLVRGLMQARESQLQAQATEAAMGRQQAMHAILDNRELATQESLARSAPFRAQERSLRIGADSVRDEAAGLRALSPLARSRTAGLEGQFTSTLNDPRFAGMFASKEGKEFARAQREQMQEAARGGGRAQAEADIKLGQAEKERLRAIMEERRLRAEIAEVERQRAAAGPTAGATEETRMAKLQDLNRQLGDSTQRRQQAEQGVAQAMQATGQIAIKNLETEKQFRKQAAEFARQEAAAAREKLTAGFEELGFMDPEKRKALLQVGQQLKAGGAVDPEMLALARNAPLGIGDLAKERAIQDARADPIIQQMLREFGAQRDVEKKEREAKQLMDISVKLEQKVEAKLTMNEQALAKQLSDAVIPQVHKLVEDLKRALRIEIEMQAKQQRVAARAANAHP